MTDAIDGWDRWWCDVFEYWRSPATIEGEFVDDLRKRQQELEAIVAPYLTGRKTRHPIIFKGKRRYLRLPEHYPIVFKGKQLKYSDVGWMYWTVNQALRCLYNLEAAWKAGDFNEVIRWTYGIAIYDFDVKLGTPNSREMLREALEMERQRAHQWRVKGGENSKKWDEGMEELARPILHEIFDNGKVSPNRAYELTKKKLMSDHQIDISVSTLKKYLPIKREEC